MIAVRRSLLLILLTVTILAVSCRRSEDRITGEIRKISEKFVPDKRIAIFNVEVKEGRGDTIILVGETTLPAAKDTLFRSLDNENKNIIDSILILPDTLRNKKYMGLVTLSVVNLRKEPDHSSELVSQAILGTPVMILKQDDGWFLVQTPDRYISWTEKASLRVASNVEMAEWRKSERMVYLPNTGWIYSNMSQTAVTGDIVSGCIVSRTGESGDFLRVALPDGREGFIEKSYLMPYESFVNDSTTTSGIIKKAESMIGIPYLWGGSSPKGADCSGFMQCVYFMNGLILSRDASQQAEQGSPVDISKDFRNLRAGDLLFFGRPGRITHVAMYKADSEYIHSSGRVMINSLDSTRSNYSPYRRNTLIKAMRMAGSDAGGIMRIKDHPWY